MFPHLQLTILSRGIPDQHIILRLAIIILGLFGILAPRLEFMHDFFKRQLFIDVLAIFIQKFRTVVDMCSYHFLISLTVFSMRLYFFAYFLYAFSGYGIDLEFGYKNRADNVRKPDI